MTGDDICVIDCATCAVRGPACDDCVVSVMLGGPPGPVEVEPEQQRALRVLARAGLVPGLRMTPVEAAGRASGSAEAAAG